MSWPEWEQIKAGVAERHSDHMELNRLATPGGGSGSAGPTGSGGTGTLRHFEQPWHHAAAVAGELHTSLSHAKRDLDTANKGTASGLEGLSSLGSLGAVLRSWDDRLSAIQGECRSLQPALRAVSTELGEIDHAVGTRASSVHAPNPWKGD